MYFILYISLVFITYATAYNIISTPIDVDGNYTGYRKIQQASINICNYSILLSSESQPQTVNRQIIIRMLFNDTLVNIPTYLSYNSSIYQDVYTIIPVNDCSFIVVMRRQILTNTDIFLQIVDFDKSNIKKIILGDYLSIDDSDLTKGTPSFLRHNRMIYMTWRSTIRPTNSTTYYQIKLLTFQISNISTLKNNNLPKI